MRLAPGQFRSSALSLGWAWLALVVYASLFPFEGWRWPAGLNWQEVLRPPWPRYFPSFDIASNLLGYLPLGLLVALARLRHGAGLARALWSAVWMGTLTSYGMEVLQVFLPPRVPSALDWLLNGAGALAGGLLALALHAIGAVRRWEGLRERWLRQGNGAAMALLVLWPVALLFPSPVPFGLGQVASGVLAALQAWLLGVPWAEPAAAWLADGFSPGQGLSVAGEFAVVMLGVQAPCLLAFATARRGWRRLWLATGAVAIGVAAMTLSTALNFGPGHAMAWLTSTTLAAMGLGLLAMALLAWAGQRLALALGLMALTMLVLLVNRSATDPYLAHSLQAWEQGRFIRFHGLAQWIGWLWPYAAMAWFLGRLARGVQRD